MEMHFNILLRNNNNNEQVRICGVDANNATACNNNNTLYLNILAKIVYYYNNK